MKMKTNLLINWIKDRKSKMLKSTESSQNFGKFFDKENGLFWLKYDINHGEEFTKQNDIIDTWSANESVKKYVTKRMPISSKLLSIMSDRKGMYYAYENDKLVGVVLLTHAEKGYSFATIEYIVVGPEAQGKGVGTRMINSIKSNPQFFINNYQGKIDAYVNSDNMPSKRAFLKNKYVVVNPPSDIDLRGFYRFVYQEPDRLK